MQTLEIAETLEDVGIEHKKAFHIAETINGRSGLATKEDVVNVKSELKQKISDVENGLKQEIHTLDKKIDNVKGELKQEIHTLDKKIDNVKGELKEEINNVKSDVKVVKWMVGICIALTSPIVTGMAVWLIQEFFFKK